MIFLVAALMAGLFFLILGPEAAISVDVNLFKIINAHHTSFLDGFFLFVSYAGSAWVIIPLFFVFVLWRTPKKRRVYILVIAAAALSINAICNAVIKQSVGRERPAFYFSSPKTTSSTEEERSYEVHIVGGVLHDHSFPSGHTNTIFAVATLIVFAFGMKLWPTFLAAMIVAYSRVYLGAHFPLDTLAGACLGIVIVLSVWHSAAIVTSRKFV
jgi:undecaprenyl-diphosphatase